MAVPSDHSTADKMPFLSMFARALIEWNNAETAVRGLVAIAQGGLSGPPHLAHWIVVIELKGPSIIDALRALATDVYGGVIGELLKHAAAYFERLAAYRNYYVHGLAGAVTLPDTGYVVGKLNMAKARGKMSTESDDITIEDLSLLMERSNRLNEFCNAVQAFIMTEEADRQTPPELIELPPALQKTRTTLAEAREQ